ncbi:rhodanese-like domain-containing protein [Candidatus Nomurabacteria bacterium]|nr:rhodanese-like domain-containing protein [Candidatus Nomurabacteria bacterium]
MMPAKREELKRMLDEGTNMTLLDVLPEEYFKKEHIPGSINIHKSKIEEEVPAKVSKDKPVVTYCASFECTSSIQAAAVLESMGYDVYEFDGGMDDWKDAGYNVEGSKQ